MGRNGPRSVSLVFFLRTGVNGERRRRRTDVTTKGSHTEPYREQDSLDSHIFKERSTVSKNTGV